MTHRWAAALIQLAGGHCDVRDVKTRSLVRYFKPNETDVTDETDETNKNR